MAAAAGYDAGAAPPVAAAGGADLAALQTELKAAKEKWADMKLGKAKKEAETFPYPVWLLLAVQQPSTASAYDVLEIPVKLLVQGLEPGQIAVEVPSAEIPKQLQEQISEEVVKIWKKNSGKKAAPWGIVKTLDWVETNFVKLLSLDPACIGRYEGVDDNGGTMFRYAIGEPAKAPVEGEDEESEADSEEEAEYAAELMRQRIAAIMAEPDDDAGGKKKLTPEEIERRKAAAEEMGAKTVVLSKEERAKLNMTRKEKSGTRTAKTGAANKKFDGEGATSKEDKKKKQAANLKKKIGA